MLAVTDILRHVEQNGSRPARGRDREGAPQEFGNAARLLDPDQLLDRRPQDFDLAAFLGHVLPGVSAVGVAGKRDDRRPGVQRLDQAGHQVGGARPERAVAYSRPIGDPRIGFGRKGAAALVVDQEMLHAELSQRVVERQELEAAHAEHRPDPGEPQHLGHRAAAVHAAGGAVARLAGVAHACFSRSAAARRTMATNSRALMPGATPSAAAQRIDARHDTILIGRARVADARTCGRDRGGGNVARVERREPCHAGFVDTDTGIVEECRKRVVFERRFWPSAQQSAMRSGDDDHADVLGADRRGGVERPHGGRLGNQQSMPTSRKGGGAGSRTAACARAREAARHELPSWQPSAAASGFAWVTMPRAIMSAPSPMRAVILPTAAAGTPSFGKVVDARQCRRGRARSRRH